MVRWLYLSPNFVHVVCCIWWFHMFYWIADFSSSGSFFLSWHLAVSTNCINTIGWKILSYKHPPILSIHVKPTRLINPHRFVGSVSGNILPICLYTHLPMGRWMKTLCILFLLKNKKKMAFTQPILCTYPNGTVIFFTCTLPTWIRWIGGWSNNFI